MANQIGLPSKACVQIQADLLIANQPANTSIDLGFIESLNSPDNKQGFVQLTQNGKGYADGTSSCTMKYRYGKPDCEATGTVKTLCAASLTDEDIPFAVAELTFDNPTDITSKTFQYSEDQFNCSCETKDSAVAQSVSQKLKRIYSSLEVKLLNKAWSCLGTYCNGEASNVDESVQTLNIFSADGSHAQPNSWFFIHEQKAKMKMSGTPKVVGGIAIQRYQNLTKTGGFGANSLGATAPNVLGLDLYYSSEFDAWIAGKGLDPGDYAIVYFPGLFQHVNYLDNVGEKERATDTSVRTTLSWYNNGREYKFDYRNHYDEKCEKWQYLLNTIDTLFCMPMDDLCDDIEGNGRFLVKLGCGNTSCGSTC
jgi:hypothetical protein